MTDIEGEPSLQVPKKVQFSETVYYDDGLVPVNSRLKESVELYDSSSSKGKQRESDNPPPARREPRIFGLRKKTFIISSVIAVVAFVALLGGVAGGIARHKSQDESKDSDSSG
jgi:hypothetical protein